MTQAAVVGTALASALSAAASSVLQHRSARTAAAGGAWRLLGHLLTRPLWLGGLAAGAVGLVLHAVALSGGRLALVQPLLVSGVLFALPVSVVLEGRRPSAGQWLWALALVSGLSAFLLAGDPRGGQVSVDADVLAVTTAAGCCVVGVLAAAGLRRPGRPAAVLLGSAAGLGYGVTAALLKQTSAIASHGADAVLVDWPVYALVGVGAVAIGLTQLAYRAGPLAFSMPALTVADPASSVAIGALAFRERLRGDPGSLAVEVVGFVVMSAATAALARRTPGGA